MIESQGSGRRVVVTGVGVTAPCGVGAEAFWSGLAKPMEAAVVREAPGFDSSVCGLSRTDARRLDRFAQFAVVSSAEALTDAGLLADPAATGPLAGVRPARVGVLIGSAVGGAPAWDKQMHILREKGARRVSPRTIPMVMPNSAAAAVSMRWSMQGPCETIATACATGTHAIGAAARWIASGRADLVIAGAAESCLTPIALAAFGNMRALSTSGISRPFDANRDGFCASEGAGVLVLEEAEHAVARRARVYAEVSGVASTADAYHITAPSPDGTGAVSCMRLALDDAELTPSHVTHVNAHGTSTPLNDATEVQAIRTVFGHHRPAVTSVKGVTGHSLGASGAVEAVALMLSYARRTIPPTMHTTDVDPALSVDVVLSPRPWEPAPAITNSFAFGGHNSSVVFVPPGHRDVARADGG